MACTEISDSDRDEIVAFVERHWHAPFVMSKGQTYHPHKQPGFIVRRNGQIAGLLTYHLHPDAMEILTLNSTVEGHGIGTKLVLHSIGKARELGCHRVWLSTTNDNLRAIGFYQRLGFRMVELNLGAVDEARKIKDSIPVVGERGIPIRDEIVMALEIEPFLEGNPAAAGPSDPVAHSGD